MTWSARFIGDAQTAEAEAFIMAALKRAWDDIIEQSFGALTCVVGSQHHGQGDLSTVAATASAATSTDTATDTPTEAPAPAEATTPDQAPSTDQPTEAPTETPPPPDQSAPPPPDQTSTPDQQSGAA